MIRIYRIAVACIAICLSSLVVAEMEMIDDDSLSGVSGQEGIDVRLVDFRVNADTNGYMTNGFDTKYVTRNVDGTEKAVLGVDETSLAVEMEGAIGIDVDSKGVKVSAPDSLTFTGDGYRMKNVYVNGTGSLSDGGVLLDEVKMTGTFDTTGSMWISSQ